MDQSLGLTGSRVGRSHRCRSPTIYILITPNTKNNPTQHPSSQPNTPMYNISSACIKRPASLGRVFIDALSVACSLSQLSRSGVQSTNLVSSVRAAGNNL